jgi:hypothetical protein
MIFDGLILTASVQTARLVTLYLDVRSVEICWYIVGGSVKKEAYKIESQTFT